ncbi:MAG: hypothetical protein ACO1HP_09575 [Bacteroidota bacterium]
MAAIKSKIGINSSGNSLIENVSASTLWVSDAVDVSRIEEAVLDILFGRTATTAAGAGVIYKPQYSPDASGNNWRDLHPGLVTQFAACESEAVTGTVNAGATALTMSSTTNLLTGEWIYVKNGTLDNSEWRIIKSVNASVSVVVDALDNAQTSSTVYDLAEHFSLWMNLRSVRRIRVVADGSLFTQAFDHLINLIYRQK